MVIQGRRESGRILVEHPECGVVARDHGLEGEVSPHRKGGRVGAHGEPVADRHKPDLRGVKLVDQCHVAEYRRIAHVVDGLLARSPHDNPVGLAERHGDTRLPHPGRMVGAHQRHLEAAGVDGAPRVHRVEPLEALRGQPHAEVVIGDHRGAGALGDRQRVPDMVAMAMRDQHMRGSGRRRFRIAHKGGIPCEEGIDQDNGLGKFQPEGGMSEPGDLHGRPLSLTTGGGRVGER